MHRFMQVGLEEVSPGVDIDDDGHRRPYAGEDTHDPFRLELTLVDAKHAHIELASGHAAGRTRRLVGDHTLERLADLSARGDRLE